jgi:hypothetical protein
MKTQSVLVSFRAQRGISLRFVPPNPILTGRARFLAALGMTREGRVGGLGMTGKARQPCRPHAMTVALLCCKRTTPTSEFRLSAGSSSFRICWISRFSG